MMTDATKKKAEFYEKCVENNWTDMNDDTQSLKAKVLAKDMGLNYRNIHSLFNEGKKADQEIKTKAEEKRKKQLMEEERQAVKGNLIVSFIKSEDNSSSDGLKVYRRPDKSFYYVYKKKKTEGLPVLSLKAQTWSTSTYRGPELIYSSATVGGITTGGVDYIEGKTIIKENRAIRSILEMTSDTEKFNVKWVIVHSYAIDRFKNHRLYSDLGGSPIKCFERTEAEREEDKKAVTQQVYLKTMSMDKAADLFSYIDTKQGIDDQKGKKIIDLVNALFAKEYPKSADEQFEDIFTLLVSSKSEEVEKGIKNYKSIKDDLSGKSILQFNDIAVQVINNFSKSDDSRDLNNIIEVIKLIDDKAYLLQHCHDNVVDLIDRLYAKDNSKDISRSMELSVLFKDNNQEISDKYENAKARFDIVLQREKEEAILNEERNRKRNTKIGMAMGMVCILAVICLIVLNKTIIPNIKYNNAVSMMESGDYKGAIKQFAEVEDYKDSIKMIEECSYAIVRNAEINETVTLGTYEQDNNTDNGKEDIEWIVLNKSEDSVLLISKYGLDCMPYNTQKTSVTWETCSLREWLNNSFLNEAFGKAGQNICKTISVTADSNPSYSTDPGNDTDDKIFLLSVSEVEQYFSSDEERLLQATAYAKSQGANVDNKGRSWWWLRSPGGTSANAATVSTSGSASERGINVLSNISVVRPALWVKIQ